MGSVANKYRVHEVAKDFGIATKDVTEILTKYAETPKNHMQALEDRELSLIFEYLTQHNQIASIATIFAEGAKVEEKKPEPKKQQPQQSKGQEQIAPEGRACGRGSRPETPHRPEQIFRTDIAEHADVEIPPIPRFACPGIRIKKPPYSAEGQPDRQAAPNQVG